MSKLNKPVDNIKEFIFDELLQLLKSVKSAFNLLNFKEKGCTLIESRFLKESF